MKKQFLLLLLMTLLPLAGWAEAETIESVSIADVTYQGGNTSSKLVVTINGKKASEGYNIGYYSDPDCQEEVNLRDAGTYYAKVTGDEETYKGESQVSFQVKQATLTVVVDDPEKVYGEDDPTTLVYSTMSQYKDGDDEDNVKITFTLTRDVTDSQPENVGTHNITNVSAESKNYKVTVYNKNIKLNITPATLYVTLDVEQTIEKVYGEEDPTVKFSYSGWLYDDEANASTLITTQPTIIRGEGENVGDYTITGAEGAVAQNYTFNYAGIDGQGKKLTIKAKNIADEDIDVSNIASFTYDGTAKYLSSETGLTLTYKSAQGDKVMVRSTDWSLTASNSNYTNNKNASTEEAPAIAHITGKGNYEGSLDVPFTINKADLTIKADDIIKTFGDDDSAELTATVTGISGSMAALKANSYTVQRVSEYADTEDADTYENAVEVVLAEDFATKNPNYNTPTLEKGSLIINPATATITAEDVEKTYGEEIPTDWYFSSDIEGLVLTGVTASIPETVVPGDEYKIKVEGPETIGNYAIKYVNGTFTYNKKDLTVKADDKSKSYGAGNPEFTVTYIGLLESDKTSVEGKDVPKEGVLGGTLAFNREVNGDKTKGQGNYDIEPYGLNSDNYDITFEKGILTIGKATVRVEVADVKTTYGDYIDLTDTEKFVLNYKSGLAEGDTYEGQVIKTGVKFDIYDGEANLTGELSDEDRAKVILRAKDGYTIKATGATSTNYVIEYTAGTLNVAKREIGWKVKDQTINYGEEPQVDLNDVNRVSGSYGYNATGSDKKDVKADLGLTITVDESYDGSVKTHEQVLKVSGSNSNYTITQVYANGANGNLTVQRDEILELLADNNDAAKIKAYDGQEDMTVKVTLKRKNVMDEGKDKEKTYGWNQYDWNTMVLPFDVSVRDLSYQLGYAIVNLYDTNHTTEGDAKFYLEMNEIPANTPFLVKTAEAISEGTIITFVGRTIKYAGADDMIQTAANGISFCGTYENVVINKTKSNGPETYWKYYADNMIRGIGATSENEYTVYPFTSYFDWTAPSAGVRSMTITVEDVDGSVTAISSIDAESNDTTAEGLYNLNGVKMDGAPTQKGIYIKNGKKVVIR